MGDISRFIINHMFSQNTGRTEFPGPFLQLFLTKAVFGFEISERNPIKRRVNTGQQHVTTNNIVCNLINCAFAVATWYLGNGEKS